MQSSLQSIEEDEDYLEDPDVKKSKKSKDKNKSEEVPIQQSL